MGAYLGQPNGPNANTKLNSLEDESYSYDELQNAFEELA
jgi:hypothetical protein